MRSTTLPLSEEHGSLRKNNHHRKTQHKIYKSTDFYTKMFGTVGKKNLFINPIFSDTGHLSRKHGSQLADQSKKLTVLESLFRTQTGTHSAANSPQPKISNRNQNDRSFEAMQNYQPTLDDSSSGDSEEAGFQPSELVDQLIKANNVISQTIESLSGVTKQSKNLDSVNKVEGPGEEPL